MQSLKVFMRLLTIDGKRVLKSSRFWCAALIVWAVTSISTFNFGGTNNDVISMLSFGTGGNAIFLLTLCILPAVPYSASYASDINTKAMRQWCIRSGIVPYALSKFIIAVISGMLAYLMGMIMFVAITSLQLPLLYSICVWDSYTQFQSDGKPLLYICCYLVHYALSAGLMAGCAFFVSTIIPNAFVATAVPVVLYFIYLRICNLVTVPEAYNAINLVQEIYNADTPAEAMLAKVIPVFVISFVLCLLSVILIRRRSMHE